jgi:hypothetical protein
MTSDVALLALHGLRLKGFAETSDVAELYALDVGALARQLSRQQVDQLVVHRAAAPSGWRLTPAGREENERMLAEELDRAGARPAVRSAYQRFLPLNRRVLQICSRWQVRDVDAGVVNDHSDPAYDGEVLEALADVEQARRPLTDEMASSLDRFGAHDPRLAAAVERVLDGDRDWFTRPVIDSYHTVWFELHEDLLATLGLDRAAEAGGSSR